MEKEYRERFKGREPEDQRTWGYLSWSQDQEKCIDIIYRTTDCFGNRTEPRNWAFSSEWLQKIRQFSLKSLGTVTVQFWPAKSTL